MALAQCPICGKRHRVFTVKLAHRESQFWWVIYCRNGERIEFCPAPVPRPSKPPKPPRLGRQHGLPLDSGLGGLGE